MAAARLFYTNRRQLVYSVSLLPTAEKYSSLIWLIYTYMLWQDTWWYRKRGCLPWIMRNGMHLNVFITCKWIMIKILYLSISIIVMQVRANPSGALSSLPFMCKAIASWHVRETYRITSLLKITPLISALVLRKKSLEKKFHMLNTYSCFFIRK